MRAGSCGEKPTLAPRTPRRNGTMGASTPLTYAIGDIHGRLDLLTTLLTQIEWHRAGRDRTIVFLGDYIDRGPDSARVIATVRKLQAHEPDAVVCLKGNH